jgi:[acyl-carrier-protein] S-malonyltransferase
VGFDRLAMERMMRVGAIFPGQGSQTVGMGGALAETYPVVANLFEQAEGILGYDLLSIIRNGPDEKLRETQYSQPAIFVVNYGLALVAKYDGLPIVASAGHSFAEFCSLTLARSIAFGSALRLVRERGLAMQAAAEAAPGAMSAVLGIAPEALKTAVERARDRGRVRLANFNSPSQIVISGDRDAVVHAGELALEAGAKKVVPLNVSGAWHSELMEPARKRFAPFVEETTFRVPEFTVISNVDAQPYRDVATIKANLVRSVTDEVLWHTTAERLVEEKLDRVVEFGGSAVLAPMFKRLAGAPPAVHVGDETALGKLAAGSAA